MTDYELSLCIEQGVIAIMAKYGKSYLRHMVTHVRRHADPTNLVYTTFLDVARFQLNPAED